MIPTLLIVLYLAAQAVANPGVERCTEDEMEALRVAELKVTRGDGAMPGQFVEERGALVPGDRCAPLKLARSALLGWIEARKLAAVGGAPTLLGPTTQSIEELAQLRTDELTLEADYAHVAIRAAIAAAQDERPEMELLLTHARDLSERLTSRGRRAIWPRSFNLLAGELWMEVDRYEEARLAFERAWRGDPTPVAAIGMARANDRLGHRLAACDAYRRVGDAAPPLRDEARVYLASCP